MSNPDDELWETLLGPLAGVIDDLSGEHNPLNGDDDAVFLADQEKAFERVGHAWLQCVMDAWDFPPWVKAAFNFLMKNRSVRSVIGGKLGPI